MRPARSRRLVPTQAADGIDEFLIGFAARAGVWPWAEPRRLRLHAIDTGRDWHVQIGPERVAVARPDADDATPRLRRSRRPRPDLLLLLWNRIPPRRSPYAAIRSCSRSGETLVLVRWTE